MRILIVEDQGIIARALKIKLDRMGHEVTAIADTAHAAIQAVQVTQPDLILMDIILKGDLDGIQASEVIRSQFKLPVIFLTAHSDAKTVQRAMATDPCGYVVKPYEEEQLRYVIDMGWRLHKIKTATSAGDRLLECVLGRVTEAVIALDGKGSIQFLNPASETLTGWKQADARGKKWEEVFGIRNGHDDPAWQPALEALRNGAEVPLENCTLTGVPSGNSSRIGGVVTPLKDDQGSILGAVLVLRPA
jgi:two-component system, cell cycle sensor histidine kinase and response regulator CckA